MADNVTVEVKGLDELQKKLMGLEEKVAKKGIRAALGAGARILLDAIIAAAPRHTGFLAQHFGAKASMRHDELAGSIYVGPQGRIDYPQSQELLERVMGMSKREAKQTLKNKKGRISVVSVVRFLEFGTSKMPKHPFMTAAADSRSNEVIAAVAEKLKEAVET